MSINLMELMNGYLGKDAVNLISGLIGEGADKTQGALSGAIPAVLGALISKASSPSGAEELMGALDNQDASMLDNLSGLLGGQGSASILSAGSDLLKMLFGGNLNSVLDVMSRSTGLGGKSMGSLLAVLAPIAMSVLKNQRSKLGLDVGGLVKLLMGQKDLLQGKLPGGFGDLLGVSGLTAAESSRPQTREPVSSIRDGAHSISDSPNTMLGKLLPVIALLALALIAWQLFNKRPDANTVIESPSNGVVEKVAPDGEGMTLQGPSRDESIDP